jgi:hypothetical protein
MKLIILRLDSANKPSLMSEGVIEIRINSQSYKGINLTTRHTQTRRAPRVTTVHDGVNKTIRAHLTLVHVFHAYVLADILWVAYALSHCTLIRYGRITSVLVAHDATKFGDSICLVCISTFKCLFIQTRPMRALTDIGGGYHLGALNFRSDHSPSSSSNILPFPQIATPGLQLCQNLSIILLNHIGPPSIERVLSWMDSNHSTSTVAYTTTHSVLSLSFFHRCKQSGLVRVFLVQLRFYQTHILKCIIMK